MNAFELSIRLRAFRDTAGYTDPEAAAALGLKYGMFRRLKNQRGRPCAFSLVELDRRLSGHDPRVVNISPEEFARRVRDYRARHVLTQQQAAIALGTRLEVLKGWEHGRLPHALAVPEILSRLDRPIDTHIVGYMPRDEFVGKVRAWRESGRLTQIEAARALGVSVSALQFWERGAQFPYARTLRAVLPILDAPPPVKPPKPAKEPKPSRVRAIKPVSDFGPRLRAWRKASRLNRAEACEILGLSHPTVLSTYERSRVLPKAERRAKIEEIIAQGPIMTEASRAKHEFAGKLKAWRHGLALSQFHATIVLGLPRDEKLICAYEKGKMLPQPDRLARLLAIIDAK